MLIGFIQVYIDVCSYYVCLIVFVFCSGYTEELEAYRDKCNEVLQEVSDALEHLKQLQANYVFVSTKTSALHEACEHLLADQVR